jgi:ribosomal protein S18 acetylase RimI-like enzyme
VSRVRIRTLTPAEAIAARDIRLESLRLYPTAFGNSWEEESVQPLNFWVKRLRGPARWFVASIDEAVAGIAVVSLESGMKVAHNAKIGAVYVREAFHRRGVARALMQSAMEHARTMGAVNATLTVTADNLAARKLYEQFGFVVCGQLERELNVDGSFSDELLMRARIF